MPPRKNPRGKGLGEIKAKVRRAEDVAASVQGLLAILGHTRLRARKVGRGIVIESGPTSDPFPHARLMPLPDDDWRLDFPKASGRWQPVMSGPRGNLVAELHSSFPWTLNPLPG